MILFHQTLDQAPLASHIRIWTDQVVQIATIAAWVAFVPQ